MSHPPFQALAGALGRAGRRLGPGELADLQVMFAQPRLPAETLRAQVASVIARDPGEWARVATLVDHWLAGELDAEGRIDRPEHRPVTGEVRPAPPAPEVGPRATWVDRLLAWSPRRVAVSFVVALAGTVLAVVWASWEVAPPIVTSPAGGGAGGGPTAPPAPVETVYTLARAAAEATVDAPLVVRLSPVAWAVLSAVALALWVVGTRLRRLPEVARAEEAQQRAASEVRSRDARAELETRRVLSGAPEVELWQVPVEPPLAPGAVVAAASTLLRLRDDAGRPELDLARTLRATVEAGGRFTPALAPRSLPGRVLVWMEVPPEGEHAWSRRVDRALGGLRTLGVELERWEYAEQPDRLRAAAGPRLDAADVGRRTAGWPVLVLGRGLSPWTRDGRRHRPWSRARRAWGRIAWVDPDPSGRADPELARLEVRRFPFTEAGIEGAARWLAGDGRVDAPADPQVAHLPEAALWRWALAAAMVPEATWDQLEAIRLRFPELARELPGPWAVRALADWVARQPEAEAGLTPAGPRLLLPPALEDRLLREYRARAPGDPGLRAFVDGVNRLLLDQLGADASGDGLARALWELKTGWIRARVEPARAAELLARVLDGPLAADTRALIEAELARQAAHPVPGADWGEVDRKVLRTLVEPPAGVPLVAVARGARGAWPRPLRVVAVAAGLALAGAGIHQALPAAGPLGVGPTAAAVLPPSYTLREESGELRPAMVRIEAGAFRMGSPVDEAGRDDDEGPVEVRITRAFLLAATEVTQGQYRRVMGEEPWGEEQRGDELPAHSVSWEDALRYCNRLSEREGLTPAYDLTSDPPTWSGDADGYRLPTEAEWEYAARAGLRTRFVGTDVEAEVCRFGNYADESAKTVNGGWTVVACDDGVAGIAPVGRYRVNAWGLFDMGGNVFEWTWDPYAPLAGGVDPVARSADPGASRVFRGGSWDSDPQSARVAFRGVRLPSGRYGVLGFRPARSPAP